MNNNISRLVNISKKDKRYIIGLMSGTSLDGLDIALCEITGSGLNTKLSLNKFTTINYDDEYKNEVKEIFSKKNIDLQKLCLLNEWIGSKHAAMINDCLLEWETDHSAIDLIASHGQTIYHAPKSLHQEKKFGNATLQIGDGDHIAVATGIITISDFRQKHIAAGAEGAPLAVYGDYLLFSKKDEDRILLNIGGIANFTRLKGNMKTNEIFSTDTGPGNTLMDALIQLHYPGKFFDDDATIAKKGHINENLLMALKEDVFFKTAFPKTTGPELFNLDFLNSAIERSGNSAMKMEDIMSTLNKFSADTIAEAIKACINNTKGIQIICSGGGIYNSLLMEQLKLQLNNCSFQTTEMLGIDPNAKEAVLFAVLANESICGNPSEYGSGSKGMPSISMGKISFPV